MNRKMNSFNSMATITILVLALIIKIFAIYASFEATISVQPDFFRVGPGDGFTITLTISNVKQLSSWQVALEYNGTILKCESVWIPEENVFSGKDTIEIKPIFDEPTYYGLRYLLFGSPLLSGSVDVTYGCLFMANFSVKENGNTNIRIATESKPVKFGANPWETWFTFLMDSLGNEIKFETKDATVLSGEEGAKPVAHFSVIPPEVKNSSLIIHGHSPVGIAFARTFAYLPTIFDASNSYDPDGNITVYLWNFGDGNITETYSPTITHTYDKTGTLIVELIVFDNDNPPKQSEKTSLTIVIGLVLEYFDWTPLLYITLTLIITFAGVLIIQKIRKKEKLM
ncbi:MAG: PKD domain-containing protein [Candidatus Bathyarchaeia archaeon]|nr:PKD domain-containing protein [Candidatus Bathyarchaeia archaeon]